MSKIISFFTVNVLVKNRLSAAFTAALLMLFIVGFFAFQTVLQLTDDYGNVALTYEVMRELDEIVIGVSFAQTELRAFYLTSDSSYIRTYRIKIDTIHRHLNVVRALIENNPLQQKTFAVLKRAIADREEFNERKITAVVQNGQVFADKEFTVQKSQAIVHRINSLIYIMESAEKQLLSERKLHTTNQTKRTLLLITFGGFISVSLLLIVFLFLTKEIRQRKETEKEIRNSEKRLINFLEAVPAGIYILKADGKPYYANEEAKKILGVGIEPNASPENLAEIYHAYIQGTNTRYPSDLIPIVRALKGERSTISDIEIWKPDVIATLYVTGAPIYDSDGNLQYAMAAFVDISEQKQAQQQLADSEERFRQIIENASDIIYRTDEQGRFTYINPTGLTMLGYTISDVIGMHFTMFVKETERQKVARNYYRQMLAQTKTSYYEFSAVKKNGEVVILGQSIELLFEKQKVVGFLAIARNITAQKLIEEELKKEVPEK